MVQHAEGEGLGRRGFDIFFCAGGGGGGGGIRGQILCLRVITGAFFKYRSFVNSACAGMCVWGGR